jgi:hypothetical protein
MMSLRGFVARNKVAMFVPLARPNEPTLDKPQKRIYCQAWLSFVDWSA